MFASKIRTAALIASLGAALYAAPSHAIIVNDAFDGGYFNPAQNGRGGNVDVIPAADGVKAVAHPQLLRERPRPSRARSDPLDLDLDDVSGAEESGRLPLRAHAS